MHVRPPLNVSRSIFYSASTTFAYNAHANGIRSSALSGLIEAFLDDSGQVDEQLVTLSAVGRAVHHGKQFRLQIRQQAQDSLGLAGVWHVAGQRSLLQLLHRVPRRLDQIRGGDRLDVAEMMKQVG